MSLRVLVETDFLLALNPRDRNHRWALSILEEAKNNTIVLHISPAALVELTLFLKSRGITDSVLSEVFETITDAITLYTLPRYPVLTLKHLRYASELRSRYRELSFFDSIHASISIIDRLVYMGLDSIVRKVVESEKSSKLK